MHCDQYHCLPNLSQEEAFLSHSQSHSHYLLPNNSATIRRLASELHGCSPIAFFTTYPSLPTRKLSGNMTV